MFPNSTEDLLQDAERVSNTPVSRPKYTKALIVILFVVIILGLLIRVAGSKAKRANLPITNGALPEVTALPATNTFVDSLFGTVVFYANGNLQTLQLPDRSLRPIVGVSQKSEVLLGSSYPPVWSPDGKLLALVTPESKIVVTEFDTGKYRGTFPLPAKSDSGLVHFSIDPANEVLAIWQTEAAGIEASVRFFSLETQKELGVYPRCSGAGVWMTGVGFAMTCQVATTQSVVVIRFEPNSSVMTPLAREAVSVKYQIIDEYKPGSLLLKRMRGNVVDLIALDANGKITTIAPSEYKAVPDIDQIAQATAALRARIEKEAHTKPVVSVSVASDNSFVVFETEDGLYLAKLDLKDPPFFLGKGTNPSVRPS